MQKEDQCEQAKDFVQELRTRFWRKNKEFGLDLLGSNKIKQDVW